MRVALVIVMTHRFRLRRFRFNLPQRIAAGLLRSFSSRACGLPAPRRSPIATISTHAAGARLGEALAVAGYFTTCGNIHDGILAYRLAGLPLTLNLLVERALDHFRKPEDRVVQARWRESALGIAPPDDARPVAAPSAVSLLPASFSAARFWWVTRRLYGNLGGYTALALYCFSPAVLKACVAPNPEVLTALGVYGGVYTCIGVAHAMQGPRRKWRPRIVLLTAIFGVAAASHIAALPVAALLGLVLMLWVAEGHGAGLPVVLRDVGGALVLLFACYGFSPDAFSYVFRSAARLPRFSLDPARGLFFAWQRRHHHCDGAASCSTSAWPVRATSATPLRSSCRCCSRSSLQEFRLAVAVGDWHSCSPSLEACSRTRTTRTRAELAIAAAGAIVALQAVFCILSLPGLL